MLAVGAEVPVAEDCQVALAAISPTCGSSFRRVPPPHAYSLRPGTPPAEDGSAGWSADERPLVWAQPL